MTPLHLSHGSAAAGIFASMMLAVTHVVGMEEATCWWQGASGSLGGPVVSAAPLPLLLSDDGEVHGTDDESTAAMSRSSGAAAGGSRCCSGRWSSDIADMHVNSGGVVVDVGGSSTRR
jgi:hypothetical protein